MKITFDPPKRLRTLAERGLDFAVDAEKVFAGQTVTIVDDRKDYREVRQMTIGSLNGRTAMIIWTERGTNRHIISMRYCHAKEERKLRERIDLSGG